MIHQLREQGLTICEIARRMRVDRKAVRRYLQRGVEQPGYGPRAPRPQKLEPYRLPSGMVREVPAAQRDTAAA